MRFESLEKNVGWNLEKRICEEEYCQTPQVLLICDAESTFGVFVQQSLELRVTDIGTIEERQEVQERQPRYGMEIDCILSELASFRINDNYPCASTSCPLRG